MSDESRDSLWQKLRPFVGAALGMTVMAGGSVIAAVAIWTIPTECLEIAGRDPRPEWVGFPRSLGVGFFAVVISPAALLLAGLAKACSKSPWATRTASIGLSALTTTALVTAVGYAYLGAVLGIELR